MKHSLEEGGSDGVSGKPTFTRFRAIIAIVMLVLFCIVVINATITYGSDIRPNEDTLFSNSQTIEIL